jgi:hypothetical protein
LYNKITAKKRKIISGELVGGRRVLTDAQNGSSLTLVAAVEDDLVVVDDNDVVLHVDDDDDGDGVGG